MEITRPTTRQLPSSVDRRPAVTVLAGFSQPATQAVARVLMLADPRLATVSHDIGRVRKGVVRRTIRTAAGIVEDTTVDLVYGCVSYTLREDVLPQPWCGSAGNDPTATSCWCCGRCWSRRRWPPRAPTVWSTAHR